MRRRLQIQLKRYGSSFALLLALIAVGSASGFYILLKERLPNPLQAFYAVNAAFPTAAGVVPGIGEPVDVAGVQVGVITGTTLRHGQAILEMAIDPSKMPRLYGGASAQLVPQTPLDNMQIDIRPGRRSAGPLPNGATIPVAETTSPTSLDEFLDLLDSDTRSWLASLITGVDQSVRGRGADIRRLLGNLAPTATQLRAVTDLLASRRHLLRGIVHNLAALTRAASGRDAQLHTVIAASDRTLHAFASQEVALRDAISQLPGTLSTARTSLQHVTGLANALDGAATALLPSARRLPSTLRDAQTLFNGTALLPLRQIPPFVAAVLPLAHQLPALTGGLGRVTPSLMSAFKVLAYTTNEAAYGDPGNRGFLYWTAWLAHDYDSALSTADAHGAVVRGSLMVSCDSLKDSPAGPLLSALLGPLGC